MVEWSLPRRKTHGFHAELRTDVSGFCGSVVTHRRSVVEISFVRGQRWRSGTTACPADAVEFARDELASTVRARWGGS